MPDRYFTLTLFFINAQLFAADAKSSRIVIEGALNGSIRESSEIARDANRKPVQAVSFFGLETTTK